MTAQPIEAASGARSRLLRIRGLRYHLWTWGSPERPLLVCCHGWLDTGGSWQFVARELARRFHVVAPDWRGFGYSQWEGDHYWFPDYVADLDALVEAISPQGPVRLVGHSMGGQASSLFAGVRPDRVSRLALLDSLLLPDMAPELAPKRRTHCPSQQPLDAGTRLGDCQGLGAAPTRWPDRIAGRSAASHAKPHPVPRCRILCRLAAGHGADAVSRCQRFPVDGRRRR